MSRFLCNRCCFSPLGLVMEKCLHRSGMCECSARGGNPLFDSSLLQGIGERGRQGSYYGYGRRLYTIMPENSCNLLSGLPLFRQRNPSKQRNNRWEVMAVVLSLTSLWRKSLFECMCDWVIIAMKKWSCMQFFSLVPAVCGRPEKDCRETMAGVLLRSFTMAGSQADGEGQRTAFWRDFRWDTLSVQLPAASDECAADHLDFNFLIAGKFEVPWFYTQEDTGRTLAEQQMEATMGGHGTGCNAYRDCTIGYILVEFKAP